MFKTRNNVCTSGIVILFTVVIMLNVNDASPPHQRMSNADYDKLAQRESGQHNTPQTIDLEQFGIEYQRYLQQVIEALESDPEFKRKLESVNESDIRSGKIAEELEYVSHHVRSKLDELKRIELDRLRQLAKKQYELTRGNKIPKPPGHLDHSNPDSFEIADLQKLIYKVAEDLQEADKQRKELFKEYEMQKHFERDQKLSNMTEEEKKLFMQHENEEQIKRQSMQKEVHHPGSRQQLEEVWEKQDHLDKQDFNPKVFFAMHDLDSNGFLDEDEIKVLFINELNKLYGKADDLVMRDEEMERMREHVFNEIDLNKDRLISWDEFYSMSVRPEFNQDTGWKPIEENSVYTQEELEAFERNRQAEINKLVQEGKINPSYNAYPYHPGQGYQQGVPPPPQNIPYQQGIPSQQNIHHQQQQPNMHYQQQQPNMHYQQQQQGIPQQQNIPHHQQQGVPLQVASYQGQGLHQQGYGDIPSHGIPQMQPPQPYGSPSQGQAAQYGIPQNQQQQQKQQQQQQIHNNIPQGNYHASQSQLDQVYDTPPRKQNEQNQLEPNAQQFVQPPAAAYQQTQPKYQQQQQIHGDSNNVGSQQQHFAQVQHPELKDQRIIDTPNDIPQVANVKPYQLPSVDSLNKQSAHDKTV